LFALIFSNSAATACACTAAAPTAVVPMDLRKLRREKEPVWVTSDSFIGMQVFCDLTILNSTIALGHLGLRERQCHPAGKLSNNFRRALLPELPQLNALQLFHKADKAFGLFLQAAQQLGIFEAAIIVEQVVDLRHEHTLGI
jgi:hypothetical protein